MTTNFPQAEPVAQQPEAPHTQDDDLVARLNGLADNWTGTVRGRLLVLEAAARIESDAQALADLKHDMERLYEADSEHLADLAASRERERTARQLLQRLVDWADDGQPRDCSVSEKTIIMFDWDVRKYLASTDSAASPTGGEG